MKELLFLFLPLILFAKGTDSILAENDSTSINNEPQNDWRIGFKFSLFDDGNLIEQNFDWYGHGKTNIKIEPPKIFLEFGTRFDNINLSGLFGLKVSNYTNNFDVVSISDYTHFQKDYSEFTLYSLYLKCDITYYFLNNNKLEPFISLGFGKVFTTVDVKQSETNYSWATIKTNESDFQKDINSPILGGITCGIEYLVNPSVSIVTGYKLSAYYASARYKYEYLNEGFLGTSYFINRKVVVFSVDQCIDFGINYLF